MSRDGRSLMAIGKGLRLLSPGETAGGRIGDKDGAGGEVENKMGHGGEETGSVVVDMKGLKV